MSYDVSETPIAFEWPDYQVPGPVLTAVEARPPTPQPPPRTQEPLQRASFAPPHNEGMAFWVLIMLFILQLAVIGVVADIHVQQKNLTNILMLGLAQKKFGGLTNSVR